MTDLELDAPPPSRAPLTGDLVLDVVEALAKSAGVVVDRAAVRAATREDAVATRSIEAAIAGAAGRVGLDVRLDRRRADEWPGGPSALALFGQRFTTVDDGARSDAIAETLGAAPDDELLFLVATPAAPLATLRTEDGPPKGPLARAWSLAKLEQRDLVLSVVYAAGYGLMSLAVPVAVETLVGTVAFGSLMQPIVSLMVLLAAALAFAALMRGYQFYVVELIQRRIFARAAVDVAHRMPRVSLERFDQSSPAELVNRFFDAITVQKSAGMLLVDGLAILLEALLGMALLAFYHPFLAAFDGFLLFGILFVLFVLGRGGPQAFVKTSKAKFEVAAWLEEIAHHPIAFKAGGGMSFATERAGDTLRRYLMARSKRFKVLLRQIVGTYALQVFANTALLGIGGYLVIQRQLTIGQLVASNLIVAAVVEGFTKFGKQIEAFYDLVAGADKLGQLTDLPMERDGGTNLPVRATPARIELRELSTSVGGRAVLERLDAVFEPGDRVLVVGGEGSGKSVLADVLFGLRSPDHGTLRVDGVDARTLSLSSLRGAVALARGVDVFDGTIADNVVSGADCDPDALHAAVRAVGLTSEIEALPTGFATRLGEKTGPLSSGQRRRLALARAITQRPRLLLVDELIDGLDDARKDVVLDALTAEGAPWTLVVFSNDRALAPRFSRVLRLDGGTLTESSS